MLGGVVRGRSTTLRVPCEADLPELASFAADLRVRRGGRGIAYWAEPAMPATWKERLEKASEEKLEILWAIEAGGELIGSCAVRYESNGPAAITAGIQHFTIAPDRWRRGFGWDAALTLHRWIFDIAHLQDAALELPVDNVSAARISDRLGYAEYARGTRVYYQGGAYADQTMRRMRLATWDERWGATEREYPDVDAS